MKRMIALILMSLVLSGCTFGTRVYTNETEPSLPSFSDMEMVVEEYYVIQEISKEYADGRTEQVEFQRADKPVRRYDDQLRTYNASAEYYENEQLVRTEVYEVDDRANVIRMVSDGDENRSVEYLLAYDEHDQITEKRTIEAGQETKRETFTYNEHNQVTEYCEYEEDHLVQRIVTEYDESGWRTSVTCYDGDGNVLTLQMCTADAQKYSETVLEYNGAGTLLRQINNGYDIGKNLVVQEVFDANGDLVEQTYWRYATGSHSYLKPVGNGSE